jgi:glycosyltransferase involved in cell wall biosynthesis
VTQRPAAAIPPASTASVAVCIPTYNQAHLLPRAVASAAAQSYEGPLEIWVSDDASTDDTPGVLARLGSEYPELHVLAQPVNAGIAANASAALRAPRTDFLVRLDSDDELIAGYVDRLAKLMSADPRAGYAHTQVLEIDEYGQPVRTRHLVRSSGFQDSETALRASLSGYRAVANIQMFRREALEQMRFYDGRPNRVEDYDLAIRLADAGYGNIYVAETLASYRVWNDAAGLRSRQIWEQLEGYRRIFDETFPPAWRRRGWNERELTRRRNKLAGSICATCFASQHSAAEREQLLVLLLRLGDGPGVRVRVRLCRLGLTPLVGYAARLPARLKHRVKALLVAARRISRGPSH